MKQTEKAKGNQHVNSKTARSQEVTKQTQTLSDVGIYKNQSSKWQKFADVPEEDFENRILPWLRVVRWVKLNTRPTKEAGLCRTTMIIGQLVSLPSLVEQPLFP